MNLVISEFKRIAARHAELQEFTNCRLAIFSWDEPSDARIERACLLLEDACGYLAADTSSIALYQSSLWRHPTPIIDDEGSKVVEPLLDETGKPFIYEGQPVMTSKLIGEEYRGIILTDSLLPKDSNVHLRRMRGSGGETRLLPYHRILIDSFNEAGHALRGTPDLMQLLWTNSPPIESVDPLVLWVGSVVKLAHQGELLGDLVQQGWWWWKSLPDKQGCQSQITEVKDGDAEYDLSRRACKIHKPVLASSQAITWMLEQFEKVRSDSGSRENEGKTIGPLIVLSSNKRDILKALLLKGAFDSDHRQNATEIAVAVAGKSADVNAFKEPLSELVQDRLVESKKGRGGGYWLTLTGKVRAEKL